MQTKGYLGLFFLPVVEQQIGSYHSIWLASRWLFYAKFCHAKNMSLLIWVVKSDLRGSPGQFFTFFSLKICSEIVGK